MDYTNWTNSHTPHFPASLSNCPVTLFEPQIPQHNKKVLLHKLKPHLQISSQGKLTKSNNHGIKAYLPFNYLVLKPKRHLSTINIFYLKR